MQARALGWIFLVAPLHALLLIYLLRQDSIWVLISCLQAYGAPPRALGALPGLQPHGMRRRLLTAPTTSFCR